MTPQARAHPRPRPWLRNTSWEPDLLDQRRGANTYTYTSANQLTSMTPPVGALTGYAYNSDGRRTDTWWSTNTTHTTFAAHTHTDFDAAGRVGRTWTGRNNLDTTRVFDTTYCYTANTGGLCPTGTNTTNPTKGLIQWSLDNLSGARSIYSYDGANKAHRRHQLRRAHLHLRL